jgi:hypothetical protein
MARKELLDDNQREMLTSQLDGFQVFRCGMDLIRLRRLDNSTRKPAQGGRMGFLEYNDLRQDVLNWWDIEQAKMFTAAFEKIVQRKKGWFN